MLFSSLFNEGGKNTANQQVQHFFSVSQFQATTVRQLFLRQGYIQIFFCHCVPFWGESRSLKWSEVKWREAKWSENVDYFLFIQYRQAVCLVNNH